MAKHYLPDGGARRAAWIAGCCAGWIAAFATLGGCGSVVVEATGGGAGEGGAGGETGGGGAGASTGAGGQSTSTASTSSTPSQCGCTSDADCGGGDYCVGCACVACAPDKPCQDGLACCGNKCEDLTLDENNCGSCGKECLGANATMTCAGGECYVASCDAGFSDCDGASENGCEVAAPECGCAECECVEGNVTACYTGPPDTLGVGLCTSGIQTCLGGLWGPCEGDVTPSPEVCDSVDNDCDGAADEDQDGDGWTVCDGDCCDDPADCTPPGAENVNPGAIEVPGNGADDDCVPFTLDSDPLPTCSLKSVAEMDIANQAPVSSLKLVKAMDLCWYTLEDPPTLKEKTWGLISTQLTLADGSSVVQPKGVQVGVLPQFGPNVGPIFGETMAALSSGTARAEGMPGYAASYNAQTQSTMPQAFLDANGGSAPPGCGAPCSGAACTTAYDPVRLAIRMRTPTNMGGFYFSYRFYTAEYPEGVCSSWNDFFVALLSSQVYPTKVNLAGDNLGNTMSVNEAFFSSCEGCMDGTAALVGTGIGGLNGALNNGAATSWHTNPAMVVPGETIELDLVIWDAADHSVASTVLLDAFTWVPASYFLDD